MARMRVRLPMRACLSLLCIAPAWAWQTFTPSAFTIQRIVGQLGFATEVEWQYYSDGEKRNRNPLDPNQPSRTVEASGISVRLYQGELFGGEKVLLKEYLSCAREIGENELSMYGLLCDGGKENPPQLGSLLGHMQSDSSFDSAVFRDNWSRSIPSTPPPASGNLWLVFRWEGLATVGNFPRVPQPRPWLDLTGGRQLRDARAKYLMVLTGRCLQVLAYLHGKGVVHRSLGPSSLLLSTSQQDEAARLTVRLVDLGFAASASSLPQEEVESAMRRGASSPLAVLPMLALNDLHGLGYVLLELFLASAAAQDAPDADTARTTELQSLKRLVEDIYEGDVCGGFREFRLMYCSEEPAWAGAVEMLDQKDGAGWGLLQQMVDCRKGELAGSVTARGLLESCKWFE